MINRATLTGRLTKDPEIFNTNSGTPYCNFTLAVDRQFRNKNGERDADFIKCVIWRKSAKNFANFTHKGALVGIDGRIQTRNYQDNNGNRVYITEVVVDDFALLEPRRNNQGGYPNNNGYNQNPQLTPDQVPTGGNNGYQQGNQGGYQNNQSGYNQQQNNGQNYQQGQLDTGQTSREDTGAGQKMNQLNNQNNGYPQNGQNGLQNNSGNQQGNYPNQQGNNAQGQQEQSQDGNQDNGNLPF